MFVMWSPSPPSSLSLNLGVGGRGGSLKIRRPPLAVRACLKSMLTQVGLAYPPGRLLRAPPLPPTLPRQVCTPPGFRVLGLLGCSWALLGFRLEFLFAPGGFQEGFCRVLVAVVARRRCPRRSRRPPGSIVGAILASKTVLVCVFFRASVAWCFSLAFGHFWARLSFC